ncbi:glucosamine-6-phosphate deaminase [Leifsonia bigeumensis]|uniref:Glucosamine-6-phosphate deaminase n=1 Tax=Leifsonella bigeumensis TaxID=433643 RepID=A0ABP7FIY4_9MICO
MENLTYDKLEVTLSESNEELGIEVAKAFADAASAALAVKDEIAVILATGNSQLSFARAVRSREDIDWSRITILHMDEYLGMSEEHPASFRRWMQENLVAYVSPKAFEGVRGDHEPVEEELERYSQLVRDLSPSITVMGIGENGHLAFNDPPAEFETSETMKLVDMDEVSRKQQVGEGHFPSLAETPQQALSLTIPALLRSEIVLVGVPEERKATAVKNALEGSVSPNCPASILQTQGHARVFLDRDSASLLDRAAS